MESFALTDIGKARNTNQDSVFCSDCKVGLLPNLYIVADGMGGHNAGDLASKFCVDSFINVLRGIDKGTIINSMEYAIRETNDRLIAMSKERPELEGMGTTFVAATVEENVAYILNVGDSRLYLINSNGIEQITEDHSLVEEMVKNGELERKKARNHPNKNIITRALGVSASIIPDFFETNIEAGDLLLLCSDGLTSMVDDKVIHSILSNRNEALEKKVEKLLDIANANGGEDNISIVAVQI